MSEAATPPTTAPSAASLYPADGGAAAAAATALAAGIVVPGADTTTAPVGNDTVAGSTGADTVAAGAGTDTVAGSDTTIATGGEATVAGGAGTDTISADAYTITLPEGFTEDAALLTEAKTTLAAAGVAPDKVQGLIDLFAKAITGPAKAAADAFTAQQNGWLSEINAMPEFQGPTRETSLQSIGRLFDEYGTPEVKAVFDGPGKIGNNPALARFMLNVANALTEGAPTLGGRPAPKANEQRGKATTVGQSLYPDAT